MTAETVDQVALGYLWGRYAPWWGLLIRGAVLWLVYRQEIAQVLHQVPLVWRHLQEIRRRDPVLYDKLLSTTRLELLQQIPRSVQPADPAFILGRLQRAHEQGATSGQMAGAGFGVLLIILAFHMPGAVARALTRAAEVHGVELLETELKIATEAAAAQGEPGEQTGPLEAKARALGPELDRFVRLWGLGPVADRPGAVPGSATASAVPKEAAAEQQKKEAAPPTEEAMPKAEGQG